MKYTVSIELNIPRHRILELFDNSENRKKWQPDLISFEPISGVPGEEGAKSQLIYKMGKQEIEMVETIIVRKMPETLSATYEAKGVWNRIDNRFIEKSDTVTLWEVDSEFTCSGFIVKLMTWFAPGMFKKQTMQYLEQFKAFAEAVE